ncbi:DNA topoisomerase IV subunit B [Candidatus Kaiserbacteria bacterium RIFCSPLOWO2_02_FULL_45_11b]|uniref:DNA topoisomerase (ATP-hydrolyzing) n=1 Tax=Candidatus Kaiserbacteria bacterium RIFCSPLOWO2_12_FULL_45_26 TaxID=1798525 RepID=A0A1F6FHH9_9BACT|nr:MAG: DNA topoisomerase IV subunit B [Candidatus Kaiserbacteria bacterium RIFCSPLOWO2_01_FULL_45_25]OGG83802.1 MAG: DNA topoisomerase IV subunit B [Candidatus Kaiserbacteria bacterium RIFCSPLOWO2_02_FULL_45_11b]OGG85299.1 MAG: DNA topoisomerase IV subunit B [Candidatus Kaiserbacteria bacterium RIFCSPLOWO2_12_FULL_45_26]
MAEKKVKKGNYDASSISVLEGLEPVRKRPGMYIGTTGPDGLHHLIWEVFDNSRDEAMGGFANRVEVSLLPGGYVRVVDNGRGIPVDIHKQTGVSALETILTVLHAGGKFGGEGSGYKVSGGLHGVGVSVMNALSSHVIVEVHRDGAYHMQEYAIGVPKYKVKKMGASKLQGTVVTFQADATIFPETDYDFKRVVNHLRQQAYLVKAMHISVIDARMAAGEEAAMHASTDKAVTKFLEGIKGKQYLSDEHLEVPHQHFYFEGGLRSLVAFNNHYQKPVHKNIFYVEKNDYDAAVMSVEVAVQYVDDISSRISAYANNIYNPEHGTHITGFKTALTRTLNNYAKKNNFFSVKDKDTGFTGDDVLEGITAVVSVKMPEIQFEGQTKAKLGSVEARGAVESVFGEAFNEYLEENPDDAKAIINKVIIAVKARKAAKAAKDSVLRKGALEGMSLPGKLADCQSKRAEDSELFIVEGDSAGGSAKMGRDRKTQAILALRGKILNVERARLDKMLASEQVKNVVIALGTAIGDVFDISKLRYHKIIIATDADVDGAHIRTLLLTLFYRYFKPLIEGGFIYIAQPPLYKIQKGKEQHYAFDDNEKFSILKSMGVDPSENEDVIEDESEDAEVAEAAVAKKNSKVRIQRYKGLGEMNADELWETTMNPEFRILKQVNIEDALLADRVFDILMGTDVPSRKSFIQTNAKMANLDF